MPAAHLLDQQLYYPDFLTPAEVIGRIESVFRNAPANRDVWQHPALQLPNFIQRACWKAGINPIVPLIALQRERSLLGTQAKSPADFNFACGVVGQDKPGTVNARWNGLLTQLLLCIEVHAWSAGAGPQQNFGFRQGLWPTSVKRWPFGNTVDIYDEKHLVVEKTHLCQTAAEYSQLCFTPHLGKGGAGDSNTLDVNGQILQDFLKAFI